MLGVLLKGHAKICVYIQQRYIKAFLYRMSVMQKTHCAKEHQNLSTNKNLVINGLTTDNCVSYMTLLPVLIDISSSRSVLFLRMTNASLQEPVTPLSS
jgi:hypothetical protein